MRGYELVRVTLVGLLLVGVGCAGDGDAGAGDVGPGGQGDVAGQVDVVPGQDVIAADVADVGGAGPDTAGDVAVGDITAGDVAAADGTDSEDVTPDAAVVALPDAATPAVDAPHALLADPRIGTGATLANVGSAYPGAAAPLGLVKASPDTMMENSMGSAFHCAGYQWFDPFIHAFSHNHLHGTGAPDYGNIGVMPTVGMSAEKTLRNGRKAPYTHDDEVAQPGYYAVTLTDPRVRAEVTATTRCAHHRYTFMDAPEGTVLIDASASIADGHCTVGDLTVDPATRTVSGMSHNQGNFAGRYGGFDVFFVARFNRDFSGFGTWDSADSIHDGEPHAASDADPGHVGAYLRFDTESAPTVEMQLCLSYVDVEGAQKALDAELPEFDFAATRAQTLLAWEDELSVMHAEGGTAEQQTILYTALYHVLQMPTIWSDVDGRYRGFDQQIHTADGWDYMTDMSLWDTFRTQHPLITLLWPEKERDIMRSLVAMREQGGYVPRWPMGAGDTGSMIGEHAAAVAADSVLKGIVDFDQESLYSGLAETANGPLPPGGYGGRDCITEYLEYGYCPSDLHKESVSLTLEYAFDDFCMARLAESMGKGDEAVAFDARASSYKPLFHEESAFFRPRMSDGTWDGPFDPKLWSFSNEFYVEGTAWQWLWFAPHDEPGLRALFGGDEPFVAKLDSFFQQAKDAFQFDLPSPFYYHGNEPDIHASSLFARAGRPDLAQAWTRWILDSSYKTTYDGLVGNDDAGTLSSWYAFASMGLYPTPCVPGYTVLAPIFDKVTLRLPTGDVIIEAPGATDGKSRVSGAAWNGTPVDAWWIDHAALLEGGTLSMETAEP